jgi:hypothetical protein
MMLDSSQLSTKRLNQSMTATKYRKPPRIGMSVICMRQANPIYTVGGVGDAVMGWANKRRWYRSGGAGVAGKPSKRWPNTKPAH